ncbi:precorrin-2 C(20)-methyltransferase [Puteibacter caeruleilacunae]|nr:precorrin-2 C(20)-methyltransferase [Puteibacter caeruleilacunae]
MKHHIKGVAIGPGDPELITLKALNALKDADIIFYPETQSKSGSRKSHSGTILEAYKLDSEKLRPIHLPMKMIREETEEVYYKLFSQIKQLYNDYKKVCIVSEGDISFFSTFSYLIPHFNKSNIPFKMIPGVPAFISAGSLGGFPLTLQADKLVVLSQLQNTQQLNNYINNFETIVVMKLSTIKDELIDYLKKNEHSFFYAERIGTEQEYATTNILELEKRVIPYFSLLIINRHINSAKN